MNLRFNPEQIETDLRSRVMILRSLAQRFDPELCRQHLTYSNRMEPTMMKRFLSLMEQHLQGDDTSEEARLLRGHLKHLFNVYTGEVLDKSGCAEGSVYHRTACSRIRRGTIEHFLNNQMENWSALCERLQIEHEDIEPNIIRNIMIDESLELLGIDLKG